MIKNLTALYHGRIKYPDQQSAVDGLGMICSLKLILSGLDRRRYKGEMETSLHRQLKYHFAADSNSVEVTVDGFRIDAIDSKGFLVEIQHAGLGSDRKSVV